MMKQFDVCKTPLLKGMTLLEASAGTGKTYTLALLVVRFVVEKGIPLNKILAVTFTNASTAELKERIGSFLRSALGYCAANHGDESDNIKTYIYESCETIGRDEVENRLRCAVESIDEASVFTIHGFCQRLLSEFAFEAGSDFDREIIQDEAEIVEEILYNFWRQVVQHLPPMEYEFCLKKVNTPLNLHKLVGDLLRFPDAKREGVVETKPDLESAIGRFQKALESFDDFFSSNEEAISKFLMDAIDGGLLDKRSYRYDSVIYKLKNPSDAKLSLDNLQYLTKDKLEKSWKKGVFESTPLIERADSLIATIIDYEQEVLELEESYLIWLKYSYVKRLEEELPKLKSFRNQYGFNDLISTVREAVMQKEGFREAVSSAFSSALVDEFQDTDSDQFHIFQELFGGSGYLFMIGDPKQAIYQFRGGDVYAYLQAQKSVAPEQRYTLNKNYRSQKGLIDLLNSVFTGADSRVPFLTDGISYRVVEAGLPYKPVKCDDKDLPSLVVWRFDEKISSKRSDLSKNSANDLIFRNMVVEIAKILAPDSNYTISDRGVKAEDIAILVGTHREASAIKSMLSDVGVQAVTLKQDSIWDSEEAEAVCHILEAVLSPSNTPILRKVLFTKPFQLSLIEIEENLESFWIAIFSKALDIWKKSGVAPALKYLFMTEGLFANLLSCGDERAITNYRHIFELLQEMESGCGGSPLRLLVKLKESISIGEGDIEQRLERDESSVKIMTFHVSKGLEFPLVFIPSPWTLTYHFSKKCEYRSIKHPVFQEDGGMTVSLSCSEDALNRAIAEKMEEYQRVFYVAFTRASYRVYTSYIKVDGDDNNPAERFLAPFLDSSPDIELRDVEDCDIKQIAIEKRLELGQPVEFGDRLIPSGKKSRSYSSLVGSHDGVVFEKILQKPEENTIHSFPKGARTGSGWHKIFEELDYTRDDRDYIEGVIVRSMSEYGFNDYSLDIIYLMVKKVLSLKLVLDGGDRFQLSSISNSQRKVEFPFSLKSDNVSTDEICRIVKDHEGFDISISKQSYSGYLTGFIDLVFCHKDTYYVLDWKSNWLGPDESFYTAQRVKEAMISNEYRLQYILYITALAVFLKQRMGERFSYDKNIGGAFYIFFRGVFSEDRGVFFSKPKKKTIEALVEHFTGGKL